MCFEHILFPLFIFFVGLVDELLVLELGVVSFELIDGLLGGLGGVEGTFEGYPSIVLSSSTSDILATDFFINIHSPFIKKYISRRYKLMIH